MTALLFLAGAALAGAGLVRRALGPLLSHAEQLMWGLVAGWTLATLFAYLTARGLGQLSRPALILLTAALWLAAALLWLPTLGRLRRSGVGARSLWRAEYAGLLLVLVLFTPVYLRLFWTRMLLPGEGGVYTGGSTWYDIGWHLAVSSAFLYGRNYPPVYTPLPPDPLVYPFMPDFLTAALVPLGLDFRGALLSTAVPMAVALTGLFYSFARRVLSAWGDGGGGGARAQVSAVLATILFLLNGGLGFLYFFEHWRVSGKGFFEFWSRLKVNYANMGAEHLQWTNLIVDALLPQRTSLFGLPLGLMILTLFAEAWRRWDDERNEGRGESQGAGRGGGESAVRSEAQSRGAGDRRWSGWRLLLAAGVLTGMLPLFHTHTYTAVGLLSGFLFLLRPRRAWLAFWAPALLLAAPHFLSLWGHATSAGFMRFQPGWRGHSEANWPLYWVRNVGVPLLVAVPAWLAAPRPWRRFYLAFVFLQVLSVLVVFTPNDYDNIKLMYYWYAATCVLVAAWLVRLAAVHRQPFIASLLALAGVASGLLSLQYERLDRKLLYGADELEAARYVREHTAPRALFLTAPTVHQPVLSLAGRAVVRGDTMWLWSHGHEFAKREADVKRIYAGADDAAELLRYYGVDFVYLGRAERDTFRVDQSFFDRSFPVFYRGGAVTVYDARPTDARAGAGARPALPLAEPPPREFASRLSVDPYQLVVEFPRAAYAVYRYYRVAAGRVPAYAEFMTDMREVGRGLFVGAPGWEALLEANKRALTDAWAERPEFKSRHDRLTNEQYTDALYANAGVRPGAGERAALVALLDRGAETRASVLRRVAEDRELYARDYNAALVLVHYFGYLRRGPADPPDKNLDGFDFWLDDLNRTRDRRSVSRVFMGAGEYIDQMKKGGAAGGQ